MRTSQDAITDTEFREALESSIESARKVVAGHPDMLLPVLEVVTRKNFGTELDQVLVAFPDLPETISEKVEVFEKAGQAVWDNRKDSGLPVAIIFTSEAWALETDSAGLEAFRKSDQPVSKTPGKKEVVVQSARTVDGRTALVMHDIKRDAKKNIDNLEMTLFAPYKEGQKADPVESPLLEGFYRGCQLAYEKGRK